MSFSWRWNGSDQTLCESHMEKIWIGHWTMGSSSSCCHVYLLVSPRRPPSPCVSSHRGSIYPNIGLDNGPSTEDQAVKNGDFHSYLKLPDGNPKSFCYIFLLKSPFWMVCRIFQTHANLQDGCTSHFIILYPHLRKLVGYILPSIDGRWITSWLK